MLRLAMQLCLLIGLMVLTGCNDRGFTGDTGQIPGTTKKPAEENNPDTDKRNKDKIETDNDVDTKSEPEEDEPEEESSNDADQTDEGSKFDDNVVSGNVPPQQINIPPQDQRPVPTPTPPPTNPNNRVNDIPPGNNTNIPGGEGTISFPVAAAANMEGDFQFSTAGYRVIVKDAQGIVGAGVMTLHAAMNAEPLDQIKRLPMGGGGFKMLPVVALKTDLQYVRPDARGTNGQGKIFVCMAQDPTAPAANSACKSVSSPWGDTWIEVQWDQGKSCSYSVDQQGNLRITGYSEGLQLTGGFSLSGGAVPSGSIMHSHEAPIAQSNVRGNVADVDARSPVVLDLNKNGDIDLLDVWDDSQKINFDLSATGEANRTGWISGGDGLLVLDVNGNGKIDSGRELFGQHSYIAFKRHYKKTGHTNFSNGYLALEQYDLNYDGVIDQKDAIYKLLKVWVDRSMDGKSQSKELQTLAEAGVASIGLSHDVIGSRHIPVTNKSNFIRMVSSYTSTDGKKHPTADVWFQVRGGTSIANYLQGK